MGRTGSDDEDGRMTNRTATGGIGQSSKEGNGGPGTISSDEGRVPIDDDRDRVGSGCGGLSARVPWCV